MRLVKFEKRDEDSYSSLVFNEAVMKMNLGRVFTEEEAGTFFQAVLDINASESSLGFYQVFIPHESEDVFIGMGAINRNEEYNAIEIEYMLLPQYWNQGYGTELVQLLVRMASETHIASRIIAIVGQENAYSQKVLLRNGFAFFKPFLNDAGENIELFQKEI